MRRKAASVRGRLVRGQLAPRKGRRRVASAHWCMAVTRPLHVSYLRGGAGMLELILNCRCGSIDEPRKIAVKGAGSYTSVTESGAAPTGCSDRPRS